MLNQQSRAEIEPIEIRPLMRKRGCKAAFPTNSLYPIISANMSAIHWRLPFAIPSIEDLAIPAVSVLILFLAYTSQYLFYYIEPGPFSKDQAIWFNVFVFCIWLCYDRACTVDPGPKGWVNKVTRSDDESDEDESEEVVLKKGMRWCRKCDAIKPPRAHHCKQCER